MILASVGDPLEELHNSSPLQVHRSAGTISPKDSSQTTSLEVGQTSQMAVEMWYKLSLLLQTFCLILLQSLRSYDIAICA